MSSAPTRHPDAPEPDADVLAVITDPPARRSPRPWGTVFVALSVLTLGVWLWPGAAQRYQTVSVETGDLVKTVTAVGSLQPVDEVEVSSELSGRVASVAVDVNEQVKAGQALATLDARPHEHAVTRAEAQLQATRASLAQAKAAETAAQLDLDRTKRLLARQASTAEALEDAQATFEQAQANVSAARARVALQAAALADARDDRERTVIVSPIDGVVLSRAVEPGQTVVSTMSATALFTIASNLTELQAEVAIDEADVAGLHAGMAARFTVSAWPDRSFEAALRSVDLAPTEDSEVVTYAGDLRLDNTDLALRPGMTATAAIEVERLEAVRLVPSRALRWSPPREASFGPPGPPPSVQSSAGDTVWVLSDGVPEEVTVHILGDNGTTTALSTDGLADGALVVVGLETGEGA